MKHKRNDCAAWHINFGGGCLNCGAEPEPEARHDPVTCPVDVGGPCNCLPGSGLDYEGATMPRKPARSSAKRQADDDMARLAVNTFEQTREALKELLRVGDWADGGERARAAERAMRAIAAMEGATMPEYNRRVKVTAAAQAAIRKAREVVLIGSEQLTCVDCGRRIWIPASVSLVGTNGFSCGCYPHLLPVVR